MVMALGILALFFFFYLGWGDILTSLLFWILKKLKFIILENFAAHLFLYILFWKPYIYIYIYSFHLLYFPTFYV